MQHAGYRWSVSREGDQWRWQAMGREDETIFMQGLANSRAEAAACLVRTLTMGVTAGDAGAPA